MTDPSLSIRSATPADGAAARAFVGRLESHVGVRAPMPSTPEDLERRRAEAESAVVRLRLPGGESVVLRSLRPDDGEGFLAAFNRLSDRSRTLRFHKLDPRLRAQDIAWLTEVDQVDHVALVVLAPRAGGVALGRFVRETADRSRADLAVTVLDDWHRRGIGKLMLAGLMHRAREVGVATLTAAVLDENRPAMGLLGSLSLRHTREGSAWTFDLPSDPAALPPGRLTGELVMLDRELERLGAVLGPAG